MRGARFGRGGGAPRSGVTRQGADEPVAVAAEAKVDAEGAAEAKEGEEPSPREGLGHKVPEAQTPELPPRAGAPSDGSPPT